MYCGFFLTFLQNLQRQYLPGHQCPNVCIWLLWFPKKCPFLCFCFCWQSTEHFSWSFFPLVMHQNESPFVLLPLVIRSFQSRYIFCSGYSAFQMCVLLAFVQHFNVSWSFYLNFFPLLSFAEYLDLLICAFSSLVDQYKLSNSVQGLTFWPGWLQPCIVW